MLTYRLVAGTTLIVSAVLIPAVLTPLPVVAASSDTQIVGNIRVEALSPSLVRLEVKGPNGFEDRPTFHIVQRRWPGATLKRTEANGIVTLQTTNWSVRVPTNTVSLDGISIVDAGGKLLYTPPIALTNASWLPGPAERKTAWAVADTPRLVPPAWSATPPPANNTLFPATSGWDTNNDAPDLYVFLPPDGDYGQLRSDYLRLTGPTEMPPLYLFGLFHSRYYPYRQDEALQVIATYRQKQIPLDVMVLDTDWRVGASVGYTANTTLLPDLPGYLKRVHSEGIRTMFNDHPEPRTPAALDPSELRFRYDGIAEWLDQGLDLWWYDRNWGISLNSPLPGLRHEVWGMRVYHDMTQRATPGRRPAIMVNVDGIDNGIRNAPPDMAAHRFPIQWTGDTTARWEFLRHGVENAVYSGLHSLVPYMSEDLGGHNGGQPTPELYVRYLEYGALSPTMRPHCTVGQTRAPWEFGPEAEQIVTAYVRMRYRLLPYLYSMARENYDTGAPLVRRLDLEYPGYPEAAANDEYLLGRQLLVAPIVDGPPPSPSVPTAWLSTQDGRPGLTAEYFNNESLAGTPTATRIDPRIDFNWGTTPPIAALPATNFSCRWTGKIKNSQTQPMRLQVTADDGVRVYLDGKCVIDEWHPSDGSTPYTASVPLVPGKSYDLRVEYMQIGGEALCHLSYLPDAPPPARRTLWIPPGNWINAWSGETVTGPKKITVTPPLAQEPLFVRSGAIIPLVPQMQYTAERPWDQIALDIFPAKAASTSADLYEDDTTSNGYQKHAFRFTHVETKSLAVHHEQTITSPTEQMIRVTIHGTAEKPFTAAVTARRWTLRLRNPNGSNTPWHPRQVLVNGHYVPSWHLLPRSIEPGAMPFQTDGSSPEGDVLQIDLPPAPVGQTQIVTIWYNAG